MTTKISTTRAMLAVLMATTGASPGILQPETDAVAAASFDPETCSATSVGSVGAKYKDKSICFEDKNNTNTVKGMCCKCCGIWDKNTTMRIIKTLDEFAHVSSFNSSDFTIIKDWFSWVKEHLDGDKAMSEKTCAVITKTYEKEAAFLTEGVNAKCELPYTQFVKNVQYNITLPNGKTTDEVRFQDHVNACKAKFTGTTDDNGECVNGLWLNNQGHTCYDLFKGPLAVHMPPPKVMAGWTDVSGITASDVCCGAK